MALAVGDQAPDFSLQTESGETITLNGLRGKKVVLYFYPKDFTPGCTKESCDFRDHFAAFKQRGALVFGVSRDSAASHQKFKEKCQLPFSLLIDDKSNACHAYGVVKEKSLFGKTFLGVNRSTFLIDEKGCIRAIWKSVKVPGHVEKVLNELS